MSNHLASFSARLADILAGARPPENPSLDRPGAWTLRLSDDPRVIVGYFATFVAAIDFALCAVGAEPLGVFDGEGGERWRLAAAPSLALAA